MYDNRNSVAIERDAVYVNSQLFCSNLRRTVLLRWHKFSVDTCVLQRRIFFNVIAIKKLFVFVHFASLGFVFYVCSM